MYIYSACKILDWYGFHHNAHMQSSILCYCIILGRKEFWDVTLSVLNVSWYDGCCSQRVLVTWNLRFIMSENKISLKRRLANKIIHFQKAYMWPDLHNRSYRCSNTIRIWYQHEIWLLYTSNNFKTISWTHRNMTCQTWTTIRPLIIESIYVCTCMDSCKVNILNFKVIAMNKKKFSMFNLDAKVLVKELNKFSSEIYLYS